MFKSKEPKSNEQLFAAVKSGNLQKVKELVDAVQNVNIVESGIEWPLILCAVAFPEILEYLIQQGADINSQEQNKLYSPLINAARLNHIESAKILIKYDADLHLTSFAGLTALHYAIERYHDEITKLLLNKENDPAYLKEFIQFCENTSFNLSIYKNMIIKRINELELISKK